MAKSQDTRGETLAASEPTRGFTEQEGLRRRSDPLKARKAPLLPPLRFLILTLPVPPEKSEKQGWCPVQQLDALGTPASTRWSSWVPALVPLFTVAS